jgi:hypothetical protein
MSTLTTSGADDLNNLSDAVSAALQVSLELAFTDSFTLSDAVGSQFRQTTSLTDRLVLSDYLTASLAISLALSDSMSFSDALSLGLWTALDDTLSLSDALTVQLNVVQTDAYTDDLNNWSDEITILLSNETSDYYRRYLGDVVNYGSN